MVAQLCRMSGWNGFSRAEFVPEGLGVRAETGDALVAEAHLVRILTEIHVVLPVTQYPAR